MTRAVLSNSIHHIGIEIIITGDLLIFLFEGFESPTSSCTRDVPFTEGLLTCSTLARKLIDSKREVTGTLKFLTPIHRTKRFT